MKASAPTQRRLYHRPLYRKTDFIVLFCLLLLWPLAFFLTKQNSKAVSAQIYLQGELLQTLALHEGQAESVLRPTEGVELRLFQDGSLAFVHSNCRDQLCVLSGRHYLAGDFFACLPNQLAVLLNQDEGELDVVVKP